MASPASRVVVALAGAAYTATGAALLLAPHLFFEHVGDFAPYNRHYAGDAGAFSLAIGVGLLVAARRPAAHALVVAVGAAAALVHAANHAYDALRGDESSGELSVLLAFAGVLVPAAVSVWKEAR